MGWGGRLFEAGRLLTFSAFRMGAYSRWTLIRGWALIRINTVHIRPDRSLYHTEFSETAKFINIRYKISYIYMRALKLSIFINLNLHEFKTDFYKTLQDFVIQ